MKEKFVRINTIEGYEDVKDCYWISNSDEDKVINRNTGKMKKIRFDKYGYKRITLMTKNNKPKSCKIHIMKAKVFLFGPYPLGANVIRHLNDVKTDNRLENLAWGTASDNARDCVRNRNLNYEATIKKLSKPVRCIETGMVYPSTREAERQTGIRNTNIGRCCNGKCKIAGGFHWEFVNQIAES